VTLLDDEKKGKFIIALGTFDGLYPYYNYVLDGALCDEIENRNVIFMDRSMF
jgi:hypothetical protein